MIPLVISGPSGVGKTTLNQMLLARRPLFQLVVSVTTRPRRPYEQEGVHYYFQTEQEYLANQGDFVETETLFGNHYGTLKSELTGIQQQEKTPLFEIDIGGALQIQAQMQAHFLFLLPGREGQLRERLLKRSTESEKSLEARLAKGVEEMQTAQSLDMYSFLVNDELEDTYRQLECFLDKKYS